MWLSCEAIAIGQIAPGEERGREKRPRIDSRGKYGRPKREPEVQQEGKGRQISGDH